MYLCICVFMCVEVGGQPVRVGSLFYCGGSKKAWQHLYPLSQSEGHAGSLKLQWLFFFVPCCFPDLLHSWPSVIYGRPHFFFESLRMTSWCRVLYIFFCGSLTSLAKLSLEALNWLAVSPVPQNTANWMDQGPVWMGGCIQAWWTVKAWSALRCVGTWD